MTKTFAQRLRAWRVPRIAQMIAGSVVCIWIADVTPVATIASAAETGGYAQVLDAA